MSERDEGARDLMAELEDSIAAAKEARIRRLSELLGPCEVVWREDPAEEAPTD